MPGATINSLGVYTIVGFFCVLLLLIILSILFSVIRKEAIKALEESFGTPLTFHSPDDTPRSFKQFGFVYSALGAAILNAWVAVFAAGYVYMIVFTWLSYSPQFYAPGFALHAFGGWNGLMAPWLIIFTVIHIIGMSLIFFWEAMSTRFMLPAQSLDVATHVMIEEEVDCLTDNNLVDPDTLKAMDKLRHHGSRVKARFKRAKCRTVLPVVVDKNGTRRIEYTCVRYVYNADAECFEPTGILSFAQLQGDLGTASISSSEIHPVVQRGGLSSAAAKKTMARCGKNEINVYVPGVLESLLREFADFTYIFNSIGTWSYMIYSAWNIGIFWLILTLGSGIFRSLFIVRPNQRKIHDLAQLETKCQVLRDGQWKTIKASELVLGDVIAVDGESSLLPCDGVIVEGSLVVNESMLTGEPMPIQKMPVEKSANASVAKKNTAYAGTACLQSTGPHNGRAVMLVTAVGALTTRGQLVRMVLFPTTVRFKYNDQLPKVYLILCLYMVVLSAIYLSPLMDLKSWIATYLMVLNTIAMCLSPMLPVSMVMGQSVTASRLESVHKIGCLQPGRIPIAGKISTMVFDKTGTITKDGMDFDAVVSVEGARFASHTQFDLTGDKAKDRNVATIRREVPSRLRHALASCHTVTTLKDGTLVGNQVEVSMVSTVGWTIAEHSVTAPEGDEVLELVKKLDFDHCRMTSGVVVRARQTGALEVFIKGSYEKIQSISDPASVPADYDSKTQSFAKDGYYVLGIAHKTLSSGLSSQALADMSRDALESGLGICGLLLFRNEMKHDSPDAIRELRKGSIRSVICTGDNALTGISIGKQCGIVDEGCSVLLGDVSDGGHGIVWRDPDSSTGASCDINSAEFLDWELAVTQGAWRYLFSHLHELEDVWTRIVVFARMKPEDKINVVKYFQSRHLVVGMCGDGGNDCGGLRAAHAGLALSDAEASMVSPFATGRDGKSLITVVDLIREGRACLATNMATFQYFIVYGFTLTSIRTILALYAALSLGEYVWVTLDVGIGMIMVWTMTQSKAPEELCSYRPTATLLGPRTLAAIAFPYFSALTCWIVCEALLWSQDWYEKLNPLADIHLLPSLWMLRGDNYDSSIGMLTLMLALATTAYVNTYGGSFRKNVLKNIGVNVVYGLFLFGLSFMLLTPASQFNCIYRVNCDNKQSQEAKALTLLSAFSAGGVGGCFLGPQVKVWQQEMQPAMTPGTFWSPNTTFQCQPPPGYNTTPESSSEISSFGCVGPNNCYPAYFRWELFMVFVVFVLANHMFTKCVLLGPVAAGLRRRQRQEDEAQRGIHRFSSESESGTEMSDTSDEDLRRA